MRDAGFESPQTLKDYILNMGWEEGSAEEKYRGCRR